MDAKVALEILWCTRTFTGDMTQNELRRIWQKTEGHCHFCGDPVVFETRGWVDGDLTGYWEVDHVIQRQKGGSVEADNCLPACTRCNRLRWHRKGDAIRELLFLGLIARDEIRNGTATGRVLAAQRERRLQKNKMRRKTVSRAPAERLPPRRQTGSLKIEPPALNTEV